MTNVKNLFIETEEARRYNTFRPVYHHLPAGSLFEYFGMKIPKVLDVACGTGHSTRALAEISDEVIGCDISESMLAEARKSSEIQFLLAPAETWPFGVSEFDYVNISMAFQWLDQPRFLKEARRVLKAEGILGVDNYGFTGKAIGDDQFLEIYKSFDRDCMKAAPRNKNYPEVSELEQSGFKFLKEFEYSHDIHMNQRQFQNYLMTRSNFLELCREERISVENRMQNFYESSFEGETKTLRFRGKLKLYESIC